MKNLIIFSLFTFALISCSKEKIKDIALAPAKYLLPDEFQRTIVQGKKIDKKMIDLIEIGMNKDEVLLFLGDPVLINPFNQNKWIYLYKEISDAKGLIENHLIISFAEDEVVNIDKVGL